MSKITNKKIKIDYPKIFFVGIPLAFIFWVLSIIPTLFIIKAAFFLNILNTVQYWPHISIFLTFIFVAFYLWLSIKYAEKLGTAIIDDRHERLAADGHLKCNNCGVVTTIDQNLHVVQRSFGRKPKHYCPSCLQKNRNKNHFKSLLWITIIGFVFIFINSNYYLGWLLLNLALINLFLMLAIIPHEIGHAVAGNLLGLRVFRIILGFGKTLFTIKTFGLTWEVKKIPLIGMTIVTHKSRHWFRLKQFIMIISGPLVNALFIIILFTTISSEFAFNDFVSKITLKFNLLIANALVLLNNLWPRNIQTMYGKITNDGLTLFTILTRSQSKIDDNIALYYALEGNEHLRQKQWESAKKWYELGLSKFPNNPVCLNELAVLYLKKTGDYQKAIEIFEKLIQNNKIDKGVQIFIKNNLASAYVFLGQKELLPEADRLSKEVYNNAPWVSMYKCTRGAVLIELNNIDEGLDLLRKAIAEEESPESKASLACYIAIGEVRKKNIDEGIAYLDEAKRFDSDCYLIPKVEGEINDNKSL